MDQLIADYDKASVSLAMARHGLISSQLDPYPPCDTTSPSKIANYHVISEVHNQHRKQFMTLLITELKLLQQCDEKTRMLLIPYKSVADAAAVTSYKQLPQVRGNKVIEEDFQVPESVGEIPGWIDADGDGVITRKEYGVLEREMKRSQKLEEKNRKEIHAILTRERLQEKKEQQARNAERQLQIRKKLVAQDQNENRVRLVKMAKERVKKMYQNQKEQRVKEENFKKKYAQDALLFKEKERVQKLFMLSQKQEQERIKKEHHEKLKKSVETSRKVKTEKLEKVIRENQRKQEEKVLKRLKREEDFQKVKEERQRQRDAKLQCSKEQRSASMKHKVDLVNQKIHISNERKKLLEEQEKQRIHELSRDGQRKVMENLVRKKQKEKAAEFKISLLIQEEQVKNQKIEHAKKQLAYEQSLKMNDKKKILYSQKLRKQRNDRIKKHHEEVMRKKQQAEHEMYQRQKQNQKDLLVHRSQITLEAWKKVDRLKKKMEGGNNSGLEEMFKNLDGVQENPGNASSSGGGGGGGGAGGVSANLSPSRPKVPATYRTVSPRLYRPKVVSPKRQELMQQKTNKKLLESKPLFHIAKQGKLSAYKKKLFAKSHLKKVSLPGEKHVLSTFS